MYRSHFQLTHRPFAETVDPSWCVPLPGRTAIVHRLRYGLEVGPGMAALIGPPGVGKTLLARVMAQALGGPLVHLTFPALSAPEIMSSLARELCESLELSNATCQDVSTSLQTIRSALALASARGDRPILIVDEAHLITDSAVLESFRLLLNFATNGSPALQLLLVGLPDLLSRLPESLNDRIGACCEALPLTASETSAYVLGRLTRAGAKQPLFGPEALERLYFESSGLPRRINRLADLALLVSFARKQSEATEEMVNLAARDAAFEHAA